MMFFTLDTQKFNSKLIEPEQCLAIIKHQFTKQVKRVYQVCITWRNRKRVSRDRGFPISPYRVLALLLPVKSRHRVLKEKGYRHYQVTLPCYYFSYPIAYRRFCCKFFDYIYFLDIQHARITGRPDQSSGYNH